MLMQHIHVYVSPRHPLSVSHDVFVNFHQGSRQYFSTAGSVAENPAMEEGDLKKIRVTQLTDEAGVFSCENTKSVLINTGEKMVTALHDILTESANQEGGVF